MAHDKPVGVTNLKVRERGQTFIHIEWTPTQDHNYSKYTILFSERKSLDNSVPVDIGVQNQNNYKITNLYKNRTYYINVKTTSINGRVNYSQNLTVKTLGKEVEEKEDIQTDDGLKIHPLYILMIAMFIAVIVLAVAFYLKYKEQEGKGK